MRNVDIDSPVAIKPGKPPIVQSYILERADLSELVEVHGTDRLMDRLIVRLGDAIRLWDAARTRIQPREGFTYDDPIYGLQEWMPICRIGDGTLMKIVGYHPSNPARHGMPTILSTYAVYDADSGHLRAMMDGTLLTAMRTGAASALASQALARPDSRILGVVGCGAQAVTQVHALSRVFPIERVWAYDIDRSAAESLGRRLPWLDLNVESISKDQLADRLGRSDIVCTCTSQPPGEGPVLPDVPLPPHLHVNAVGSDFPGKIELPVALLRRALVVPDYLEQARLEGECQQLSQAEIGPDLTRILREPDSVAIFREQLTVFDSTGWALEDIVAFQLAFDAARERGLGRLVEIECRGTDPLNPYDVGPAVSTIQHLQTGGAHGL